MEKNKSDEIFIIDKESLNSLPYRSMREGFFGKTLEDALQTLLENYPQIIPGKQIDPGGEDPPQFVLLRREMPVGSWSLDHLYVDQKGVLTLVETKLIQNPESRREVMGQLIEYAANAKENWASGRVRQYATDFWNKKNESLDDLLLDAFGQELDVEDFWNEVELNLKSGRMRLMIGADEIRPEVRRMIEYLNREMQNAEVLGLEFKCYGDDQSQMVLVPTLIGQTQEISDKKSSDETIWWAVDKLHEAYANYEDQILAGRLTEILEWSIKNNIFMSAKTKFPVFAIDGNNQLRVVSVFHNGIIYAFINEKHFIGGPEERNEFVDELKNIQMLDESIRADEINSGRHLLKPIQDLTQGQVEELLDIIKKHARDE